MTDLVCENLATKAELQELRDQLNEVLGTKEDGSTINLFERGKEALGVGAIAATTLLGMSKANAPKVITDIVLQTSGEKVIWEELKNGTAKWLKFKGNGAQVASKGLNAVGKTAGEATATANLAAKGASTAAASLAVLSSLVNIATSLGLNIATVNIMDSRIEAEARGFNQQLDVVQRGMLNLYEKNKGRIDQVNQEIEENNQEIERAKSNIAIAESNVLESKRINRQLIKKIDQANTTITELNQRNKELATEINNSNIQDQKVFSQLIAQTQDIQANLDQAKTTIEEQKLTIETYETRIEDMESRLKKTEE